MAEGPHESDHNGSHFPAGVMKLPRYGKIESTAAWLSSAGVQQFAAVTEADLAAELCSPQNQRRPRALQVVCV